MELKWAVKEYRNKLIPHPGGLHTAKNFLKTIGDHMDGSGLGVWITWRGYCASCIVEKRYKLTLQALWFAGTVSQATEGFN